MPALPAKPATPAQIALYGQVAATLRAYLRKQDLKPGDLNQLLGIKRDNTAIYGWLNAKAAPGPRIAEKLAKITGIPPAELMMRSRTAPVPAPPTKQPATARPADVLTFGVQSDGEARLRLDVTLPYAQAVPLLRMLLDAGLVLGPAPQRHDPYQAESE